MSKCNNCNIDVLDEALFCPLCQSVLDQDAKITASYSKMYPNITPKVKKMRFIINLVLFLSILIEGILILINFLTTKEVYWSLICGAAILYLDFSFVYCIKHSTSHRTLMMTQTFAVMIACILIDLAIGFKGWSLSIALPCCVLALDLSIIIMMFVFIRNWQSYILLQVFAIIMGIIVCLIAFFKHMNFLVLAVIAPAASIILFSSTLIFGDKRATTELKRRFHV